MFDFEALAHTEIIHQQMVQVLRPAKRLGDDCIVVDGKRVHREAFERFEVSANVQPAGSAITMQPEGDYVTDAVSIWQGKIGGPSLELGDQIEFSGKRYEIRSATDWGPYVMGTATFISQGADR